MHLHILGICGTFMGGVAAIARRAGHVVTGCDANVYPPMSTQLESLGIALTEGFDAAQLDGVARTADVFVVGNVVSRGNPLLEAILDRGLRRTSGPQWLAENVLHGKWVLAVAGTHGKTTTSAMLAHILDQAGLDPGFLIGGVPMDFEVSARLTDSAFFVIEADEYDTAFFDKRSKFVHYQPRTAVLNNLEFDHADIFADLAAIETQFHHFVRTIPGQGRIIVNGSDAALARVLARGAWSPIERFDTSPSAAEPRVEWTIADDGAVTVDGTGIGRVAFGLSGRHNRLNALAALAAARHAGVPSIALANFSWDWIYRHLGRRHPLLLQAAEHAARAYATAGLLLRLPFAGDLSAFPRIEDVPLVARRPVIPKSAARQRLSLDGRPAVLLSFGGIGMPELDPSALGRLDEYGFLVTGRVGTGRAPNLRHLAAADLAAAGLRYEDLVGAVDVVVSKPGYGIVTDCIGAGTRFVYTDRGDFPEYPILVAEMPRYLPTRYVSNDDLRAGRLGEALRDVRAIASPPAPRTDGAEVAARRLMAAL